MLLDPRLPDVHPPAGMVGQHQVVVRDGAAAAHTLGDHRADPRIGRRGVERLLTTHRQTHHADAVRVDLGPVCSTTPDRRKVPGRVTFPGVFRVIVAGMTARDAGEST